MKLIFVSGGVISGLGKGITASSIGRLLEARGLRVSAIKIDPYLNIDAGTMNPYEHGEVYVLDDGGICGEVCVTDAGGGVLEIRNIAVAPGSQRRGAGGKLIRFYYAINIIIFFGSCNQCF